MIRLRPIQAQAAGWLRDAMAVPGEITFTAVTGTGRSVVIVEACRGVEVAFLSRLPIMREQIDRLAKDMGVDTITTMDPRHHKPASHPIVILCETLRHQAVDAPTVVRQR